MSKLPRHVAIVMDGNGRWAKQRKLPRVAGHRAGGEAAKKIIKACNRKGIQALTLFAFSIENWNRPAIEVDYLMKIFFDTLGKQTKELHEHNIQLRIIGDSSKFSNKLQKRMLSSEQETASNTGLKLNVALNYSGQWDILQAAQKLGDEVETGKLRATQITQEYFQSLLCLHDLPAPDLFIRTSGEQRISNFMLWQLAYTELYFTDILWPDFNEDALAEALQVYTERERRFGGL